MADLSNSMNPSFSHFAAEAGRELDLAIAAEAAAHREFDEAEAEAWALNLPDGQPTPRLRAALQAQRAAVEAKDAILARIDCQLAA